MGTFWMNDRDNVDPRFKPGSIISFPIDGSNSSAGLLYGLLWADGKSVDVGSQPMLVVSSQLRSFGSIHEVKLMLLTNKGLINTVFSISSRIDQLLQLVSTLSEVSEKQLQLAF